MARVEATCSVSHALSIELWPAAFEIQHGSGVHFGGGLAFGAARTLYLV